MRLYISLVSEILWKKFWWIVSIVIVFVGNVPAVLWVANFVSGKDYSYLGETLMANSILSFMHTYWLAFLLIVWFFAIGVGIFQKSRNYLGERIIANNVSLKPKPDKFKSGVEEKYVWLQVENKEDFDLRECYAWLRVLKIKSGNVWVPWEEIANENISLLTFPEFRDKEVIIHSRKPVRLNIAKTPNGGSVFFIFNREMYLFPTKIKEYILKWYWVVLTMVKMEKDGKLKIKFSKVFWASSATWTHRASKALLKQKQKQPKMVI